MTMLYIKTLIAPRAQLITLTLRAGGTSNPQRHNFRTFQLLWTKWLSKSFDWKCFGENIGVGEGICPPITLTNKKGFNRMSYFSSFFYNGFHRDIICPKDITYSPCPEGFGGGIIFKNITSRPFNYVEKNCYGRINGILASVGGGASL